MTETHNHETKQASPLRKFLNGSAEKKTANVILGSKEKIRDLWERRVREKVFEAQEQTSLVLVNSLFIFLDEVAQTLDQDLMASTVEKKGMSTVHGAQRANFHGYFLPQLLKEFSILREVLIEVLHQENALTFEAHRIIDKSIDSAISLAATEFAKVQQESIATALSQAQLSNYDLENFAAIAAHDLKSPLATIAGLADLLQTESFEKLGKDGAEYLELIKVVSGRMRNLIDSLLDYALLTKNKKPFQEVNLNTTVESMIENLGKSIDTTKAVVSYGSLPTVTGDPDLLGQLFQNLVSNAIKFRGSQPPQITITAEDQQDHWLFCVKDNGIGFDPKYKEEIFAIYKKLHGEAEYQGAGLGLATCRKIVELHGGRIWAASSPGAGSSFYFTILKAPNGPAV